MKHENKYLFAYSLAVKKYNKQMFHIVYEFYANGVCKVQIKNIKSLSNFHLIRWEWDQPSQRLLTIGDHGNAYSPQFSTTVYKNYLNKILIS